MNYGEIQEFFKDFQWIDNKYPGRSICKKQNLFLRVVSKQNKLFY